MSEAASSAANSFPFVQITMRPADAATRITGGVTAQACVGFGRFPSRDVIVCVAVALTGFGGGVQLPRSVPAGFVGICLTVMAKRQFVFLRTQRGYYF